MWNFLSKINKSRYIYSGGKSCVVQAQGNGSDIFNRVNIVSEMPVTTFSYVCWERLPPAAF